MIKILEEKIVFNENLIIEEAKLSNGKRKFIRQRLNSRDAAAVLILNTDSDKVVLTRQYRYAISGKISERIYEIVAGKVDGEEPVETVIREAEEEVGYKLSRDNIKLLFTGFSSPGYSSERFFIYYATATNADKVSGGGGIQEENEHIETEEIESDVFTSMIREGKLNDVKTCLAGLYMILLRY